MPNLPIFSQSNSVKTLTPTTTSMTSTPITQNSNFNATPLFFAIPPQMFSFMQNSITNNSTNSPPNVLSLSRQPVLSLDEFFIKLDESSDGGEEFTTRFKDIFKEQRISVNQIYDLTDTEFDQLGVNKLDGVKHSGLWQNFQIVVDCIFLISITNKQMIVFLVLHNNDRSTSL
jgi:hypothetical protein